VSEEYLIQNKHPIDSTYQWVIQGTYRNSDLVDIMYVTGILHFILFGSYNHPKDVIFIPLFYRWEHRKISTLSNIIRHQQWQTWHLNLWGARASYSDSTPHHLKRKVNLVFKSITTISVENNKHLSALESCFRKFCPWLHSELTPWQTVKPAKS
jgi:hypothetical protein